MDGVLAWALNNIASYGYPAIFVLLLLGIVGIPVPDETLLVFCGYLISRGKMHPAAAYLSALSGSWCGITVSYIIGRTLGPAAVHRFGRRLHLTDQHLERIHRWFARIGHWALFLGYFVAGARHFTAIVAGMSKLEFRSFVAYAWSGGALWVLAFLVLGYYLGEKWQTVAALVQRDLVYISLALGAALALFLLVRWKNRTSRKPRS